MYPQLYDENKLLLIDRFTQDYLPATYVPPEYLHLVIPYAGLYYEQDADYDVLSQHMELGPFSLWLHDIFARKDIVLCPYAPFHLWALHFMYEDSLRAESFQPKEFILVERECNLFNLYEEMHRVPMPAGKKILSFHINILPGALKQLVHRYPPLFYLTNKRLDNISGVINQRPYSINAVCNMLIQSILSCRYVEEQAHCYLHRCCVDLFLNFAQQDAASPEPLLLSNPANTVLFNSIFCYLTAHPHIPHSVAELANMFNMHGARLAHGFRQHFNMGIIPFIKMNRMMLIYNRLMQKSFTLSMLAEATGYRNALEMVNEVEEYYDCNVRALRRGM
jgi:AraC-like DNA-binding protein